MIETKRVKVTFLSDADKSVETMWCKQVSPDMYSLDNIPFFTYGIAIEDTFSASKLDDEILFDKMVSRSGHSTFRVFLKNENVSSDIGKEILNDISQLGCNFETNGKHLVAIDVPNNQLIQTLAAYLTGKLDILDFEEGYVHE